MVLAISAAGAQQMPGNQQRQRGEQAQHHLDQEQHVERLDVPVGDVPQVQVDRPGGNEQLGVTYVKQRPRPVNPGDLARHCRHPNREMTIGRIGPAGRIGAAGGVRTLPEGQILPDTPGPATPGQVTGARHVRLASPAP